MTNHIVVKVENHLFLKFFPVRVILNDKIIYITKPKVPLTIPIELHNAKLLVTNGFHVIKPIELNFSQTNIIGIRVETYLSNERILGMIILTLDLFFAAYVENSYIVRIVANLPFILLMLYTFFNKNKILLLSPLNQKSYKEKFYSQFEK